MADLRSCAPNYDVVALNETWLDDNVPTSQLNDGFEGHTWFRRDRGSRGGGVACAIRKSLRPVIRDRACPKDSEMLIMELIVDCVTVVVCYRPPKDNEATMKIMDELKMIDGKLVVLGDFNIPDIGRQTKSSRTKSFLQKCENLGLKQWITVPTRGHNTLDLILTRDIDLHGLKVQESHFCTDHKEIICRTKPLAGLSG